MDFPRTWIIVLVVAGLALLTPLALRTWIESRISSAASNVVGVPVEVECQGFGGAFVDAGAEFGYVAFGPDGVPECKALIKWQQCRELSRLYEIRQGVAEHRADRRGPHAHARGDPHERSDERARDGNASRFRGMRRWLGRSAHPPTQQRA